MGRTRAPVPRSPAGSSQFCSGPERASVPSDLGPGPCSLERPSGPRPARRVGGDIPEAPPPPARAQGAHGAGEGVRCDSEAGAVARQAGPGGPESGSQCVRQAEGRARRVRTLEEAMRGGAQGTGRDGEAAHGRRRIWGRREGRRSVPTRPEGAWPGEGGAWPGEGGAWPGRAARGRGRAARGERRADQGRSPAARGVAGVRGASGRRGRGPGGRPGRCCRRGPRCVSVSRAAVALGWPPAHSAPAQGWATLPHAQG